MEFVGRTVRKHFKELGVFSGVVNAYNPSTGLFQIVYEGGDSEELELSEIASLMVATKNDQSVIEKPTTRVGRKPKKRHRFEAGGDSGNNSAIFISDGERLKEIVSVSNGFNGVRSDNGLNLNDELDLNAGLDLNDGFNVNVNCDQNSKKSACIDLNLDANGDLEENLKEEGDLGGFVVETQKREHCFDLNLGLDGEMKNIDADCEGQMVGGCKNVEEACFEVSEGTQVEAICRSALGDSHVGLAGEVQKEKDASGKLKGRYTPVAMDARDFMSTEVQLKERLSDAGAQLDPGYQHNSANMCKTRNRRKRRKLSENVDSAAEVVLRRSSRRLAEERTQRIEHCFDLNLGLDEEMKNADVECQGPVKENTSFLAIEEAQKQVTGGGGGGGVGDSKNGEEACFEVRELTQMEAIGISVENKVGNSCVRLPEEVPKEKCVSGGLNGSDIPRSTDAKDSVSSKVKLNLDTDIPLDHGYQGNSTSTCKERNRRKRRKLSDSVNSATERVLRRSNRRLETSLSAQNHVSSRAILFADDESQPSPAVSSALEEQPTTSGCEGFEENTVLPSKLQLPPPSENLNLDGIPILDLFSVYTCLRSFSTLLFLSPFELEDFAEALKCKVPNMLFDFIHVSLLQTLRKQLEYLSDENSLTASNCLRSLNWDLLDLITWPIFMVEYLLTHGSGLKPGFDLCKLKLFESDYYKQPALVKIEILRCLCDDVIEVEAIRSELNRRTLAIELNMDSDRIMKIETSKGRRTLVDVSGGSCLTEEVVEETTDWNSDECCLCKMDGNLICCDGCPAAYHLRCVGIANSLLPEGDWYCPECVIVKDKPWLKLEKSLRGAELLGVDPYGRLYYSSCGYLLVSDSPDNESSYHYYHRNDLTSVIEALKSLETLYSPILGAISKQWNISIDSNGAKSDVDSNNPTICLELMKGQIPTSPLLPLHLAPSETCVRDEIINDMKPEENAIAAQYSGNTDCEVSALVNDNSETLSNFVKMENPFSCSEGSAEMSQAAGIQNFPKTVPVGFSRFAGILNDSEIQGKIHSVVDTSLTSTSVDGVKGKNIQFADCGLISSVVQTRKGGTSQGQLGTDYVNYYTFARTASMVAEDLTRKPSDKITEGAIKSVDDIISAQLKAISKKSTKFSWPNIQNLNADVRKEKCGWCFSCKASDDDRDCFFKTNDSVSQGFTSERFGLHTKRDKKGHLIDVMCYILCVEDRLHGFLLGPWLNAHYINNWRKSVVKASDVASLKLLLLMLEANLRRLALSAEWLKHVDSVATMGSASHIVTTSTRMSSKNGIGRKRARNSDSEPNPSSNAATGLGLFWWRGGKLSRELFNWKVLPRSLASKAARQAGCTKIPGVLYPDSSEFAKRSKYVAWKAAVETSRSVEQLALQVRELDANIRWDDIENTNPLSKMDQFRKSVRPFKKVIIRRKCIEGTLVKYLLDFGKRRFIPDVVMTHGSMVEESSSGRKKYWLEESHVPLHLLKGFEEKRIARKSNKLSSGKLHGSEVIKKTSKKRGFSYLFTKAERSEYYQCGHCNKDVLIREAVCCRYCKGFFHKRHVRKSAGAITAKCTYTCHKCQDGKFVKIEAKRGALKSHISKKGSTVCRVLRSKMSKKACKDKKATQQQKSTKDVVVLPLRRSTRNVKCVSLQNKKLGVGNKGKGKGRGRGKGKGKQIQSRKGISKYSAKKMGISKKPKKGTWQKKRTWVYHTYWLNGLLLSRKPNDERVMHFRSEKLVTPSEELTAISGKPKPKPKCSLCCEQESTSMLNYVCCEFCGDWFHGDAFGLTSENIGYLIGFRCHKCRSRTPPVCPHLHREASDEAEVGELNNEAGNECADIIALPTEVLEEHKFHTEENLSLDDGSSHNDHELGTVLSLNHLNAENCHLRLSEEQKREAIQIPDERRPDLSVESNEHVSVIENTTDMGTEHITAVTISVKTEFPLSKSDFNAIDTEMASLGHTNTEYDSVQTAI